MTSSPQSDCRVQLCDIVGSFMAGSRSGLEVIDFSALERELQGALQADTRYNRENQAKLRAVHQQVASYSHFRDLVVSSHLKPLDADDLRPSGRKQPWNPVAANTKSS